VEVSSTIKYTRKKRKKTMTIGIEVESRFPRAGGREEG
jgi:hypothetical protein